MLRTVLAAAVILATAYSALAEDAAPAGPITTPQGCFNMVDGLAQKWENHKYAAKAQSDKIGAELKAIEQQCEANAYGAAQKAAEALKAEIAKP